MGRPKGSKNGAKLALVETPTLTVSPMGLVAAKPSADLALITRAEAFAKEALALAKEIRIETQEDFDGLGEDLAETVALKKELEVSLKALTAPLLVEEKKHRAAYKPAQNFLDQLEALLKGVGSDFLKKQIAEQDAALKAVAESGGQADASTLVIAHGTNNIAAPTQMSPRDVWKWKKTGQPIEERFYMKVLNTDMIDAEVKALKGEFKAEGIEAYRDVTIVNQRRS